MKGFIVSPPILDLDRSRFTKFDSATLPNAESYVIDSSERERKTSEIGELIMNRLRKLDKVAYVRFASVYLDFKDVKEFMSELKDLVHTKDPIVAPVKSGKI